jgi:hypothetical protein
VPGAIGPLSSACVLDPAVETAESKHVARKNMTKERAAELLTDLAQEHLASYPPAERDALIRAFQEKAATFEKYRGIGNPGISSGRNAIVRFIRQLRGR